MSLLGWAIGLGIADSLLQDAEKRKELERQNGELAREQERLKRRMDELEREARWKRRGRG